MGLWPPQAYEASWSVNQGGPHCPMQEEGSAWPEGVQIGNTAVCGKWKWVGVETRPEVALGRRCS